MIEQFTVEELVAQFDQSWQQHFAAGTGRPVISEFVNKVVAEKRENAFRRLLLSDLQHAAESGSTPEPSEYEKRFPNQLETIRAVFSEFTSLDANSGIENTLVEQTPPAENGSPDSETDLGASALTDISAAPQKGSTVENAGRQFTPQEDWIGNRGGIRLPRDFGRYEIRRLLGQGGMGAVFLALDRQLGREVALKVPNPRDMQDERFAERFRREARIAASLRHPSLCPVLDISSHDGYDYFTMPHIEGRGLNDYLTDGRIESAAHAIGIVIEIAEAMQVAHAAKVIHRDLKPSNILMETVNEQTPRPLIIDFGLARTNAGAESLTSSGVMMGTIAYMAPEQFEDAKSVGPAADIYSLGSILFELLTGRRPHAGATEKLISQICEGSIPRLRLPEQFPDALDGILSRATHADSHQRTASMEQLASELRQWLKDNPKTTFDRSVETADEGAFDPSRQSATDRQKTKPFGDPLQQTAVESNKPQRITPTSKDSSHANSAAPGNTEVGGPTQQGRNRQSGTLWPEDVIDNFRLIRELGAGAHGKVFLAEDTHLERKVAIKIPQRPASSDAFVREGKVLGQLKHDNIIRIYQIGVTTEETCYIVSEYVDDSSSLDEFASSRSLTHKQIARMVADIAGGLAHAHSKRVIHRDIKPANILIDQDGKAHLVDFGVAVRESEMGEQRIAGSPAYMSPEQIGGERFIDGRSDIWSLGVVLYELLTKRRPFPGGSISALRKEIADRPAVPPRQLDSTISPRLEAICLKCLEKDPSNRFSSAEKLRKELRKEIGPSTAMKTAVGVAAGGLIAVVTFAVSALMTANVSEEAIRQFQAMMETQNSEGKVSAPLYEDSNDQPPLEFAKIDWPQTVPDMEAAIAEAQKANDSEKEFSLLLKAFNLLTPAGNYVSAEAVAIRMVAIADKDTGKWPIAHSQLGLAQYRNGRCASAVNNFKVAIDFQARLRSRFPENPQGRIKQMAAHLAKMMATDYLRMGNAYKESGRDKEAQIAYEKAIDICKEFDTKETKSTMSTALGNFANLVSQSGDYKRAIQMHRESARLDKETGNPMSIAELETKVGNAYMRAGRDQDAKKAYEKAYAALTDKSSYELRTVLLLQYSSTLLELQEFKKAKKCYDELEKLVNPEDTKFRRMVDSLKNVFESK